MCMQCFQSYYAMTTLDTQYLIGIRATRSTAAILTTQAMDD